MSLDIEGLEYDVFKSLYQGHWPRVLVFEYDTIGFLDYRLRDYLLKTMQYKEVHSTQNNFIFIKTNRTYDYHRTCWRYSHGNVQANEDHPCYFCGEPLPMKYVDKRECKVCGIMVFPQCHNCLCTISDVQYSTLIRIHKKYCCHLNEYKGSILLEEPFDHELVRNYLETIQTCYDAEKELGNI